MGLIKAAAGAVGGMMADQWKEFFYCDSLDETMMMVKGRKRTNGRSSNTKGNENIISNGSIIAVANGQCMMIVEQGKIAEVCAEPGEFVYDSSTEPSIFVGDLGESIVNTFKTMGKRFTFGGDTAKDQRVYYINTKEMLDNKFGTPNPIPFRIVDSRVGLDLEAAVRCSGTYSFRIEDPGLFYTNVCGNAAEEYPRDKLSSQLKAEFLSALQPAFARLSELELRPSQIIAHNTDLENLMNEQLSEKWMRLRGLKVVNVALQSVTVPDEYTDMMRQEQRNIIYTDPGRAAGALTGGQIEAMKMAASNQGGAMTGFMGMGMAMNAGANTQNLFAMSQQQQQQMQMQQQMQQPQMQQSQMQQPQMQQPQQAAAAGGGGWDCACGARGNTGKFCVECGKQKVEAPAGWNCSCGSVNQGKFCTNCGAKRPEGAPLYKCDKCGWEPNDPKNPPKFCPECGDIFDENDVK